MCVHFHLYHVCVTEIEQHVILCDFLWNLPGLMCTAPYLHTALIECGCAPLVAFACTLTSCNLPALHIYFFRLWCVQYIFIGCTLVDRYITHFTSGLLPTSTTKDALIYDVNVHRACHPQIKKVVVLDVEH